MTEQERGHAISEKEKLIALIRPAIDQFVMQTQLIPEIIVSIKSEQTNLGPCKSIVIDIKMWL